VYWFDEPDPKDYAFVNNGFRKLKKHAPRLRRMLTEQVEDGLVGGPTVWCPVSHHYDHDRAEERRRHGEEFWWYICTGPKAPYCTLFIDHPATELRVWLWQTWQRGIRGILVWMYSQVQMGKSLIRMRKSARLGKSIRRGCTRRAGGLQRVSLRS